MSDDERRAKPGDGTPRATGDDEPPPILGSWTRLYALVILVLLVIIAALRILTETLA